MAKYYLVGMTADGMEIIETISSRPEPQIFNLFNLLLRITDKDNPVAYVHPLEKPVRGYLKDRHGKDVTMRFTSEDEYLETAVGWGMSDATFEELT